MGTAPGRRCSRYDYSKVPEPNRIELVLVEDNPADILLIEEALKNCPVQVHVTVVTDGEKALHLLVDEKHTADLIILDLHLPKLDGLSVLANYHPKITPIVVLTSNCSAPDAHRALELGASECLEKATDLSSFTELLCDVFARWLVQVTPG